MTAPATFWVPGRIEVLGKHTDYAGGRSLLCALERGFTLRVTPRSDAVVHVRDTGRNEEFSTEMRTTATAPRGSWGSYVATVARRLARDFPNARRGADITLASTLPADAGLSSSSALVVGIALALVHVNELEASPDYVVAVPARSDLAGYLGAVENGRSYKDFAGDAGVGTFGGSEDHTAILCCRAGELSQYSYAPVRHETDVALPMDCTFVIGVSGVTANKTGAALGHYNALSVATQQLLEIWNGAQGRTDSTLADALASSTDAADTLRGALESSGVAHLRPRLDQFIEESNSIVRSAASTLAAGDMNAFGALVDRSQYLAETCLGNQINETIALQRIARELGAHAASAFGAGFGGSVWALVRTGDAAEFSAAWAGRYRALHPTVAQKSEFFVTRPGKAAHMRQETS